MGGKKEKQNESATKKGIFQMLVLEKFLSLSIVMRMNKLECLSFERLVPNSKVRILALTLDIRALI